MVTEQTEQDMDEPALRAEIVRLNSWQNLPFLSGRKSLRPFSRRSLPTMRHFGLVKFSKDMPQQTVRQLFLHRDIAPLGS